MSHVVTIDLEVDSLGTLQTACEKLGCQLVRDQIKCRSYYKDAVAGCQHIIKVPGASYDVALVPVAEKRNRWRLCYDNWQGGMGIEAVCGKGLGKLKQEYAAERSRRAMRLEGWNVRQKRMADGRIQLTCTR